MSVSPRNRPVVVVTGASSGIGEALVAAVPWEGAVVVGVCRRPPAPGVDHLRADLADPGTWPVVAEAVGAVLEREQPDRIVVLHAAGTVEPVGFAAEVDEAAYERALLLAVSTMGLGQRLLRLLAPRHGRRHLVLLTSGAARTVYPGWSAYSAAKAAMDQWCRVAGAEQELRGGVHLLAVAPGVVDTPMQAVTRNAPVDRFPARERFVTLASEGRLADPGVVARRIFGLLDDDLPSGSVVDLRERQADEERP